MDCRLGGGIICNLQWSWYSWRGSNAHCAGFRPAASAGLGYRSLGTSAWTRTRMSEFKARHAAGLHHTRSTSQNRELRTEKKQVVSVFVLCLLFFVLLLVAVTAGHRDEDR